MLSLVKNRIKQDTPIKEQLDDPSQRLAVKYVWSIRTTSRA